MEEEMRKNDLQVWISKGNTCNTTQQKFLATLTHEGTVGCVNWAQDKSVEEEEEVTQQV